MKGFKQRKAFTIVEMVIVIAVIAVLATVMIPTVSGVIDRANVSNDQQFVMTLNKQLAIWEANNEKKITTEKDLRAAFAAFYEADFYNKLEPKSAKQGYNYWFVPESRQVIFAKYEDLPGELARYNLLSTEMKEWVTLLAAGMSDAGRGGTDPYGFERNSLRSLVSSNNINVFLLDKGGSDFAKKLIDLENSQNDADYQEKQVNLKAAEAESGLLNAVTKKMANTAVANENGVFFRSSESVIQFVHVPQGVTSIGAYQVKQENVTSDVKEIHLPDTVEELGTDSLTEITNDDTFIYWDKQQTPDQLKDTVGENAFKGNLQLSNGETWRFEVSAEGKNNVLTNGTVTVETQPKYKSELNTFELSVSEKNEKYDLHSYMDGTRTLHYTSDFNGSVVLQVANLVDENGMPVDRTPEWKLGNEVIAAKKITLTKAQLDANSQITVTIQNLSATIDVVKVGIRNFSATLDQTDGEPFNADSGVVYEATLKYTKDSSWTIHPNVVAQTNCVAISKDVTASLTVVNNMVTLVDVAEGDQTLKALKMGANATGKFEATLTLTTVGKNSSGNPMTVTFKLKFEPAESAFTVADNANVYDKYGIDLTVGSKSTIDLGTLFALKAGKTVDASKINVKQFETEAAAIAFTGGNSIVIDKTDSNWENWTIQPTCSTDQQDVYLAIGDGGASFALKVKVAKDAYNVATYDEWVSASGKICLLADIALGNNFDTQNKTLTYMQGNMHVIDASQFNYKHETHNNCYLIKMTSGTFDSTVIVGPVYPEVVLSSKSGSTGDGYFAPGLRLSGTVTVKNSYVSGFYAPVRIDGGTITIDNTTLEGGISANIYIYNATTVTLKDSMTVQRRGGYTETYTGKNNKVIGAGIHLDTKANGTSVVFSGTTKQYNWFASTDKYSGTVETIRGYLFDGKNNCSSGEFEYEYSAFIHTIGGVAYVDMGITQEKESYSITETTNLEKVLEVKNILKGVTYMAWSTPSCGASCSHDLNPADTNGDGNYSYLDFIAARKVN